MTDEQQVTPKLLLALTPVVLTLIILGTQIFYFGVFEPHIPLSIGVALASLVGIYLGLTWEEVRAGIFIVILTYNSLSITPLNIERNMYK